MKLSSIPSISFKKTASLAVIVFFSFTMGTFANGGFFDVNNGDWFYDAVDYVSYEGLMNGPDTGGFDPGGLVNRAQLATVIQRVHQDGPLAREFAAQREAATVAMNGASWDAYKDSLARFPVDGVHYDGPGTVRFEEVADTLFIANSEGPYDLMKSTSGGNYFFVRKGSQVFGPFYDDVNRVQSEIQ